MQLASFCHSLSLGEADFCVAARPVDSLLQQERSADELIHWEFKSQTNRVPALLAVCDTFSPDCLLHDDIKAPLDPISRRFRQGNLGRRGRRHPRNRLGFWRRRWRWEECKTEHKEADSTHGSWPGWQKHQHVHDRYAEERTKIGFQSGNDLLSRVWGPASHFRQAQLFGLMGRHEGCNWTRLRQVCVQAEIGGSQHPNVRLWMQSRGSNTRPLPAKRRRESHQISGWGWSVWMSMESHPCSRSLLQCCLRILLHSHRS